MASRNAERRFTPRISAQAAAVVALALVATSWSPATHTTADVPERLSDQAFWRLSSEASEPGGFFRSQDITNLTSNELGMQFVIQDLVSRTRPGGVYLGVGPEQNFTYIAAVRPAMAVIFDIRRGNLDLQLMYKAIFELSTDRADFIALLFSKPRPAGLTAASTAPQLFTAFATSASSETLYQANLKAIDARLVKAHALPLAARDVAGVDAVYETFYGSGFAVRPSPTYADLMTSTDAGGVARSFLSSEDRFAFVKDLESRNLVIPVVGNFEGPKAIRAIAAYLKSAGSVVSAFYLSNVEQYLGSWDVFCRNVAALPLDGHSTFIRSAQGGGFGPRGGFVSTLGAMADEVRACRSTR
jgi:hypothetical protein